MRGKGEQRLSKTLEQLTRRHYLALPSDEEELQEYVGRVVDYVQRAPSMQSCDLFVIKRLTKAASNILEKNLSDELEEMVERLFTYAQEGGRMAGQYLKTAKTAEDQRRFTIMRSHLNSHAAFYARRAYDRTGDIEQARRWHKSNKRAHSLAVSYDPRHAAYTLRAAGDAARALYLETALQDWGEEWYETKKGAAKAFRKLTDCQDPKWHLHSRLCEMEAGDAAMTLAKAIYDREKAKLAIRAYESALQGGPRGKPGLYPRELRSMREEIAILRHQFYL